MDVRDIVVDRTPVCAYKALCIWACTDTGTGPSVRKISTKRRHMTLHEGRLICWNFEFKCLFPLWLHILHCPYCPVAKDTELLSLKRVNSRELMVQGAINFVFRGRILKHYTALLFIFYLCMSCTHPIHNNHFWGKILRFIWGSCKVEVTVKLHGIYIWFVKHVYIYL